MATSAETFSNLNLAFSKLAQKKTICIIHFLKLYVKTIISGLNSTGVVLEKIWI